MIILVLSPTSICFTLCLALPSWLVQIIQKCVFLVFSLCIWCMHNRLGLRYWSLRRVKGSCTTWYDSHQSPKTTVQRGFLTNLHDSAKWSSRSTRWGSMLRGCQPSYSFWTWLFRFVHHFKCECVYFHYWHKSFTLGKLFPYYLLK